MNDLYIHQLETENKQLREILKSTNEVVKEYLEKEKYCDELENRINKAIEYIKKYGTESENELNYVKYNNKEYCIVASDFGEGAELILEILGDKENE